MARWFLLLAALFSSVATASVPRAAGVWESNPPAAALLAGESVAAPEHANLRSTLDLFAGEPSERFRLFEPGAATLVEADERESFHPLQGVELIDTESRRGPPTGYPETRVWVIEVLGTTFVGEATGVSVELRPACGSFSCGVAAGNGKDPLGLFWSAALDVGFTVWDTVQVVRGKIDKTEYAERMALNVAALTADAATGGFGGGVAVRTVSLAARAGQAGRLAVRTAIAVDRVNNAVNLGQATISGYEAAAKGDYVRAGLSIAQLSLALHGVRKGAKQRALNAGQRPVAWSPTHSQNTKIKDTAAVPPEQSHHLVQDAAVDGVPSPPGQPSYSYGTAPARNLKGGSGSPGSPHDTANRIQESAPLGGTYGDERDVAYLALRAGGESRATAKAEVERADRYFMDFLGWNTSTPTVVPSTRPAPP